MNERPPWPACVAFAFIALWVVWLIGAGITGEARWGL